MNENPTSKQESLEDFKLTHQIETRHYGSLDWMAFHLPTKTYAEGVAERLAVHQLCKNLGMIEFPR